MKIYRLSLVTALTIGLATGALAENSLADAFKNGKINGELKSFYINTDNDGATPDKDALAIGGIIKYETAKFYGFSLGLGAQASYSGDDDQNDPTNDTSVGITEAFISEAYVDYTFKKTTLRYGRTFISTPLLSNSGSRLLKDFFTGGLISNQSFENTTLMAGVITDYTTRNNISEHFDDPVFTFYANSKIENFGLTAQANFNNNRDSNLNDGTKDYYLEGTYTLPMSMPLTFGAQYVGFDIDEKDLSSLYGIKTELKIADFGLGAYYTTTPSGNDSVVRGGLGHGDDPSYNNLQVLSGKGIGVDSYQAKVSYDFKGIGASGLTAFTRYAQHNNFVSKGNDASEWDIDATYAFDGSMKGLKTQIRYAMITKDSAEDFNNLRFRIDYKF
jgi:hypothetical protein